jgi:glycerate kinase
LNATDTTLSQTDSIIEGESTSEEQSLEERLLVRVAEFEGKVEALQSLKDSLYSAIG